MIARCDPAGVAVAGFAVVDTFLAAAWWVVVLLCVVVVLEVVVEVCAAAATAKASNNTGKDFCMVVLSGVCRVK
jgi:hypothetical protein